MENPKSILKNDFFFSIIRITVIIVIAELLLLTGDQRLIVILIVIAVSSAFYLFIPPKYVIPDKFIFEELPAVMTALASPLVAYNTFWNLAGIFIFYVIKRNFLQRISKSTGKKGLLFGNITCGIATSTVLTLIFSALRVMPFYFLKYLN